MLFLIALIIAVLFAWFCAEPLRKHPVPFYIGGAVISAVMIIIGLTHVRFSDFMNNYVIALFNKGAIAAALWCVIAWIGALPDEAKEARKRLLPSRGELSIFSAVMTVCHAVNYGVTYIKRLTSGRPGTSDFIATCIICLILMLIMIPLTVISFKSIRKKIKGKTWKNIQRAAYVFYALIYAHVMVFKIPAARQGREGALLSVLIYTLVFVGYAVFRIRKAFIKAKKPENKAVLNGICAAAFVLITGSFGLASRASAAPVQTAETTGTVSTVPVQAVTEAETEVQTEETLAETSADKESEPTSENEETEISDTSETSEITETSSETEKNSESAETSANTEKATEKTTEKSVETEAPSTAANPAPTEAAATEIAVEESPETTPPADESSPAEDNSTPENNPLAEEPVTEPEIIETEPEPVTEPEPETEPETEPPANTIYNDGTYNVTKFGYDSDVNITVTIENDVITDITASCNESDMYYFESAWPILKQAILSAQSPDVDAVSGSTYSSDAIRDGVREALASARK